MSLLLVAADVSPRTSLPAADQRRLTSAHMKSEVKTDLSPWRRPEAFSLLASQDDRSKSRVACVLGRPRWALAQRQLSPRIHSTVRFGERSQAHMGDSGVALHTLEASFSQSMVIGEISGQGTSQLRGLSLPSSKPNVWVSPGLPDPLPPPDCQPGGLRTTL